MGHPFLWTFAHYRVRALRGQSHAKQAVDALEAAHKVECQKTKAYATYVVRLAPPSLFG
jgi:hypothetical protein